MAADLAHERLLPSVRAHVIRQLRFHDVRRAALVAFMWLLSSVTTRDVLFQRVSRGCSEVAHVTEVRLLSSMTSHVYG